MRRVDLGGQRVAFGLETIHRGLRVSHQINETRCIAATDLGAARYPVRSGQQQSGQQADQRDTEAPW